MEPTIENQGFMFFAPPDLAAPFATKVLDKLRQPGVSDSFSLNSLRLMRQRWAQNRQEACGWSRLQQHCIGEGIIEIFLKFANVKKSSQERDFASYYALDSIQFFILNASGTERHRIFQLLKQHDFLQVCISKLDDSPLILHRYSAANSIRTFILHCPFGEWLSATQTAELLERLSRWMLVSTDRDAEELRHETNVWQTKVFAGRVLPPHAATKYARRWASMSADHLMWSSYGLLCRIPAPSRDFVLKVIQHRPVIFDLLYQCSSLPRPAWHPDIEANAAAIETLALIMQFPLTSIPHLEIPLDNSYIVQYQNDLGASVKIMEVFTSNSSWAQKLIDLWSQYDNENPETIVDLLDKLTVDWYAAQPPEAGEIMQSMRRRGAFKIASMRIIANATYVKDLKDTDVLS
ncbi:hypothetical protein QCA50_011338 [Cerrena zonata]|uniref:Uncharacterized protein n=1 Tax=Cerrena zonata TaxID=2478898 RepID=A0AAW0G2D1_9APHY